jgi:hypothetical protein
MSVISFPKIPRTWSKDHNLGGLKSQHDKQTNSILLNSYIFRVRQKQLVHNYNPFFSLARGPGQIDLDILIMVKNPKFIDFDGGP